MLKGYWQVELDLPEGCTRLKLLNEANLLYVIEKQGSTVLGPLYIFCIFSITRQISQGIFMHYLQMHIYVQPKSMD